MSRAVVASLFAFFALQNATLASTTGKGCDLATAEQMAREKIQEADDTTFNMKVLSSTVGAKRIIRSGKTYVSVAYSYQYGRQYEARVRPEERGLPMGSIIGYMILDQNCRVVTAAEHAGSN